MSTIIESFVPGAGPAMAEPQSDPIAADALFTSLYNELHRMARRELARGSNRGLGVTTLLHESYLAITDRAGAVFPDRARFMAYAARVMRGLIIDNLRGRLALKRGGGMQQVTLVSDAARYADDGASLERISDALDELATHDPALAELVDLKFFCGFSFVEIAAMRGVSERTVKRGWEKSRIYLHHALGGGASQLA
jgi:RNA polymerase sigma factor (TIGR02999 family)